MGGGIVYCVCRVPGQRQTLGKCYGTCPCYQRAIFCFKYTAFKYLVNKSTDFLAKRCFFLFI